MDWFMEFNNNRSCWELLILYWAYSCVGLGCKGGFVFVWCWFFWQATHVTMKKSSLKNWGSTPCNLLDF
jgi:hypothetical protein